MIFYDLFYEGFHTRCISMYMCLYGIEHMYTVTTGCMLKYAYMHVFRLRFQTHVYGLPKSGCFMVLCLDMLICLCFA
jgi:hypothetical protein